MNRVTTTTKVTPYNTGKVRIGSAYTPPIYIDRPTTTMYRLQTALLESPPLRGKPSALIRALAKFRRLIGA